MRGQLYFEADWRREALRTNLWLVPILQTLAIVVLFGITYTVDRAAYDGIITLPNWVLNGSADSARVVLATIAAAIITVVGIVFSITIVALTLASTQFGPRMLRNFVRDPGTQVSLGTFVASFCYAMIGLVSVGGGPHGDFVPHLSITVTFMLTLADVAVLIYFLNHIATMIQLPVVIARIAGRLAVEIDALDRSESYGFGGRRGPSHEELLAKLAKSGAPIRTPRSGYLQVIRHDVLVKIATKADAVVQLPYRPGHFLVAGQVDGLGMAARGCRSRRRASRIGPRHGCISHAAAGHFVRLRSIGRDRFARAVTRGQRHVHRNDLYRLDRRLPLPDLHLVASATDPARRRGKYPGHRVRRRFQPTCRAHLRHHPPGLKRHARHHDSPTRGAWPRSSNKPPTGNAGRYCSAKPTRSSD